MPPFPIGFWNMHAPVLNHSARTNYYVEGLHNALQSGTSIFHPSFPKLDNYLQREQAVQDAKYASWEGSNVHCNQNRIRSEMRGCLIL